ncbi:uncharacterized protein KGF55_000856 [Candida pseudojiufengensis]|uniref:uncharacterized protein n=1 Tax=Candida pseudojiufengensis TaxID=497109 RepID=UPI002224B5FB|nr:uncharacterized protein KGF55_000856 [Candida pseudojiufengensis]KAI5966547.1 hypothetical protein KGF55_000856 [Candida pseudojiufengensis]
MKILIIQTSWFLNENQDFKSLRYLINKGYDKSRKRFNLIQTQRIRSIDSLIQDLGISENQQFYLYLFIDEEITGHRPFGDETVESCFDCDVDEVSIDLDNIETFLVPDRFILDNDVINKCIATIAFKSMKDPKEFELTLYTSFMKSIGYKFLNYVLDQKLFPSSMTKGQKNLIIIAECVKEYNLDKYYQNFCEFKVVEDNILIKVDNEKNLDENIWWKASRDFHLTILERIIDLN